MAVISADNLVWYLSGGALNADPSASLGGPMSAAPVSAGLHNLFDPVSGAEADAGLVEYRCVYFTNGDENASGLLDPVGLYVASLTNSPESEIAVGLDPAGVNADATIIGSEDEAPVGVSFSTPTDSGSAIALPAPFVQDDRIAIWVRRTVQPGASPVAIDEATLRVEGDSVP